MTASQVPPGDTATNCTCNDCGGDRNCPCCGTQPQMRRHTIGLTPGHGNEWATYCVECSVAEQDWVPKCALWLDDPPRTLLAAAGFGDLPGLLTGLRALADQLRGISKHELTVQDLDDLAARYSPDDPQETA